MGYDIVVVGVSVGGLRALKVLLGALPRDFPIPVVLVQHRHRDSDAQLNEILQPAVALRVIEPEDKTALAGGSVFVAPADYHLLIEGDHLALSTDAPIHHARPAIDALFESAADTHRERVIGVILTGANEDGALGLAAIKQRGGLAIVQDPATAEGRAMPEAALAAVEADHVTALEEIGSLLVRIVASSKRSPATEPVPDSSGKAHPALADHPSRVTSSLRR